MTRSASCAPSMHTRSARRWSAAGMIGPQNTAVKTTLGPLLNGFVNYEYWAPVPKMMFPGVQEFLNTYQARAGDAGVDLLGHYMAPLAYAQMQVVAQAVEATGGFDDTALSAYTRRCDLQHSHGRRQIRQQRRMGASACPAGSVSGHSRTWGRPVQGWIETGRRRTARDGVGTIDLSLCRGAMTWSALKFVIPRAQPSKRPG